MIIDFNCKNNQNMKASVSNIYFREKDETFSPKGITGSLQFDQELIAEAIAELLHDKEKNFSFRRARRELENFMKSIR